MTARFPTTYQKLYAECDWKPRVPKTASASPVRSGSIKAGMSSGEYSRSASSTVV